MKTLSLFTIILFGFFIRWSRWLAIVQQKEYRLDRLELFLLSPEGKSDFWRLLPQKTDFTRTGLKRPVRTNRVVFVWLTSLFIISGLFFLASMLPITGTLNWLGVTFGLLLLLYFILPFVVIVATIPTALISLVLTYFELKKAQNIIFKFRPLIIGLTGSYGKTTTKLLIAQVLATKYQVFATPKSFNTRYSVAKSINQQYQGQEIALLEYGAYTKGEIAALTKWFPPQMAVVTGVTLQHVGLFGSLEEIIAAKSELVKALPEAAAVFCNQADQGAALICQTRSDRQLIPYTGNQSAVDLTHVALDQQARLKFSWQGKTVQTQLIGLHYIEAIQAAIAVAQQLEVDPAMIISALESFQQPSNFIQIKNGRGEAKIIDDGGTSNKRGFLAGLDLLAWYKKGGYQTVLITTGIVDLGDWSDPIHQELAERSNQVADQVFHLGTDGQNIFAAEMGQKLGTTRDDLETFLPKFDQKTAVLIEGKVPGWVYENII